MSKISHTGPSYGPKLQGGSSRFLFLLKAYQNSKKSEYWGGPRLPSPSSDGPVIDGPLMVPWWLFDFWIIFQDSSSEAEEDLETKLRKRALQSMKNKNKRDESDESEDSSDWSICVLPCFCWNEHRCVCKIFWPVWVFWFPWNTMNIWLEFGLCTS